MCACRITKQSAVACVLEETAICSALCHAWLNNCPPVVAKVLLILLLLLSFIIIVLAVVIIAVTAVAFVVITAPL